MKQFFVFCALFSVVGLGGCFRQDVVIDTYNTGVDLQFTWTSFTSESDDQEESTQDISGIISKLIPWYNITAQYNLKWKSLTFDGGSASYDLKKDQIKVTYKGNTHYIDLGLSWCKPIPDTDAVCASFDSFLWYDANLRYIFYSLDMSELNLFFIDLDTMKNSVAGFYANDLIIPIWKQFLWWTSSPKIDTLYDPYLTLSHKDDPSQYYNYGYDYLCSYYYDGVHTLYIKTAKFSGSDNSLEPCDGWKGIATSLRKINTQNGEVENTRDL